MVLDETWRRLDGVEALSGPHGGPLRRTVKLVLDPLVIRPVQHPECAGAMLSADGAILLATRLHAAADVLRATSAWFTLLKQTRRALRITEGNAQDLYFQRCFELATMSGMPDPVRDRVAAEAALRDIHDMTAGRTTQALKEYLSDPLRADELTELVHIAWGRRPLTAAADHTAALAELLDACAAARLDPDLSDADIGEPIAAFLGTHTGIRLWIDENPGRAQYLGLTLHERPQPPRIGETASTAALGLPLDRTIHERVFTVLQASTDRTELPDIPDLVDAEIARSCAPWALLDESLRLTAAAGAVLAVLLQPFDTLLPRGPLGSSGTAAEPAAGSAAARVINSRWQREAYVLQARRLMVRADATGPLAAIAAELQVPWRPYLRRLWARLHGRDVRELPVYAPDELWDLLDGVARSVILDHRTLVKRALAAESAAPETLESRAG
ncbi:hypothetical protein JK358_10120 [Nocardia sp. 2]|uniref:Lantibiotic biosynthesis dehydratase-like protein n=1 Tax=Nocardia acididurans TaxID=2802282 RepID=A0ABS1M6J1_9NOCA|nr:hypothetical protein [Nocardia acididurans]MBL1074753.1 hypothetical protein [Nocardia acididurans]